MADVKELSQALEGVGPLTKRLEEFFLNCYGKNADIRYQKTRYSAGLAKFSQAFPNAKRVGIVRAPGTVTLIGDGSPSNELPAVGTAIERDIVIILSPRKDRRVNLINASFWYAPRSFDIKSRIRPFAPGNWGNSCKSAAQALQKPGPRQLKGMDACVMGDIPSDSGLSGASALSAATLMALAAVNNLDIPPNGFADLLAESGAFPNTEQDPIEYALPLLAEPNRAYKAEFQPFCVTQFPFPDGYTVVVCNSLISPEAVGREREDLRQRVIEHRIGTMLLCRLLGSERTSFTLGSLGMLPAEKEAELIDQLPDGAIPFNDLAKMLGLTLPRFKETLAKLANGALVRHPKDGFKVKQRIRHVATETRRVERSVLALAAGDVGRFGDLMNQSHSSCAKDYEASTPEVDKLAEICREEGAVGARLAGSGRCVVSLVRDSCTPDFIAAVIGRYYNDYLLEEHQEMPLSTMRLENAIFPCKPTGSSTILF